MKEVECWGMKLDEIIKSHRKSERNDDLRKKKIDFKSLGKPAKVSFVGRYRTHGFSHSVRNFLFLQELN